MCDTRKPTSDFKTRDGETFHPFVGKDRAVAAAMRLAASAFKGKMRGAAARAAFDLLMETTAAAARVTYESGMVGGVSGVWCRPEKARAETAMLYLHGGSYVLGSAKAYRHLGGQIATYANAATFVADYRLAPEHPFPAAVEDATAAYRSLSSDYRVIGIVGDSAGGGLALALLPVVRKWAVPAACVAFSPWTDLALTGGSMISRADDDPILTKDMLAAACSSYLNGKSDTEPLASPLYADNAALPPVHVHVGTDEVLLDDTRRYVERARMAGVDAEAHIWEGMVHVFPSNIGRLAAADAAMELVGNFLSAAFDAAPSGRAPVVERPTISRRSPALEALTHTVRGSVVLPGQTRYDALRTPWLEVTEQHPALIVEADGVEDVAAAVDFARKRHLPLGIMATGHGIVAPCDGVLLRFTKMDNIAVDVERRIAKIGPGVLSSQLLEATEKHGLVYPAGQAGNVGVTGYTLGGGIGWLVRKLGAAVHHVVGADVVLADGSVVRADATHNADLLWALRGGGGNFGVVVSLEIALTPLNGVFGGELHYPLERAPALLRFYREWSSRLSTDTSTIFRLVAVPPIPTMPSAIRGKTVCMIGVCDARPDPAPAVLAPLEQLGKPLHRDVKQRSIASMAALDPASHLSGSASYGQVEYLKAFSDGVIDGLVRLANRVIPPITQFEVQQLGGALVDSSSKERGAFEPSSAAYLLHLLSPAANATLTEIASATTDAFAALGDVYTGEKYYNFLRGDEQARTEHAFGATKFARLRLLKERYDPGNLFHLNVNVAPA